MKTLIKDGKLVKFLIKVDEDKWSSLGFEIFIKGVIQWDGDSHLYFGDDEGYLNLGGKYDFNNLKNVLDAVWNLAEKEVHGFDKDIAY